MAFLVLLWEEILDDIDDDDKHMEKFQKSMDYTKLKFSKAL